MPGRDFNPIASSRKPAPGEFVKALAVNRVEDFCELSPTSRAVIEKRYIETAERLLRRGADINEKGDFGITALMWTAQLGFANCARLLVDKGAALDEVSHDGHGYTALVWAVNSGSVEIVRLLIDVGACLDNVNAHDTMLRLPPDVADVINQMLDEARRQAEEKSEAARINARNAAVTRRQTLLHELAPPVTIIKSTKPREKPCP